MRRLKHGVNTAVAVAEQAGDSPTQTPGRLALESVILPAGWFVKSPQTLRHLLVPLISLPFPGRGVVSEALLAFSIMSRKLTE